MVLSFRLAAMGLLAFASAQEKMIVTFLNELPDETVELYWMDHDNGGGEHKAGTVPPRGGFTNIETVSGHEFSYDAGGVRHFIKATEKNHEHGQILIVGGMETIAVRCELGHDESGEASEGGKSKLSHMFARGSGDDGDAAKQSLEMLIKPYWSPMGASRFLELVRAGYYDGVALNRVVPGFLMQFGISKDVEMRRRYQGATIADDDAAEGRDSIRRTLGQSASIFKPGFLSFAGSGADSRTTEIFVVMPDTPQDQLDYFGTNSWETPFGYLSGPSDLDLLSKIKAYGDMPPWGEGPESSRIYQDDGYAYLSKEFPELDYIDRCYVVDEQTELAGDEL